MNIYALSSGRGPSGIAIVRISGKDTLKICKNLTKLKEIRSNEVNYCKFYNINFDKEIESQALKWIFSRGNRTGRSAFQFFKYYCSSKNISI